MKLRIKDNSIRFRLTKKEVEQLHRNGAVHATTSFASNAISFSYSLKVGDTSLPVAEFKQNTMSVLLPSKIVEEWFSTDQVSIEHQQSLSSEETLSILIEKDFACLIVREGEDPSELYPNPKAH